MFENFMDLFDFDDDDDLEAGTHGGYDGAEPELLDLDGDGIADAIATESYADLDGDGMIDSLITTLESDTDGDGFIDSIRTDLLYDLDGDGIADAIVKTLEEDLDGDGNIDAVTELYDYDGDGTIDEGLSLFFKDTDGDGEVDTIGVGNDFDGDGQLDALDDFDVDEFMAPQDGAAIDGCVPTYENFDPDNADSDDIIGNPADSMDSWHWQEASDSCAVAAQEFALETLTGQEFDEADLRDLAEENGWYAPGGGTPIEDVGNILEHMGLNVNRSEGNDISDIEECLENGGQVIIGVDSDELWFGENDDVFGPGMDADHAVQVIGIDRSDPDEPMVILNDSGVANGCGAMVPLDLFMDAWEDSNCFMVEAYA